MDTLIRIGPVTVTHGTAGEALFHVLASPSELVLLQDESGGCVFGGVEHMAMALATREAIWLTSLYRSMGYGDLKATTFGDLCGDDYKKVRLSKTVDPYEMAMVI